MNSREINYIRDAAIALENSRPRLAFELMKIAKHYRPSGKLINAKYKEYSELVNDLSESFHSVMIHVGVHKTATTYLQDQLEIDLKNSEFINYIPRSKLRGLLKKISFIELLDLQNKSKPLLISDENLLGDTSTPLSGNLYPKAGDKIKDLISSISSTDISVVITLRSVTSYLSSAYCEMLRFKKYISFEKYISEINVLEYSWVSVFESVIKDYPKINFKIFNFHKFQEDKDILLSFLSNGLSSEFSSQIKKSRSSFTNKELHKISDGQWFLSDDRKFDPFTESEHSASYNVFESDLEAFRSMSNVTLLN